MKIILYILFFPISIPYFLRKFKIKSTEKLDGRSFRIYIAGTQYKNDDGTNRETFIKKCRAGEELQLIKTPSKYDEYGIQIYRKNGQCLGWVPARYSYEFTTELERDRVIRAFFHSKIKPSKNSGFYGGKVTIVKQ